MSALVIATVSLSVYGLMGAFVYHHNKVRNAWKYFEERRRGGATHVNIRYNGVTWRNVDENRTSPVYPEYEKGRNAARLQAVLWPVAVLSIVGEVLATEPNQERLRTQEETIKRLEKLNRDLEEALN